MWAKIDQKQVLYTWNCTINHRAKNSSTADDCFAPKSKPRLKILRFFIVPWHVILEIFRYLFDVHSKFVSQIMNMDVSIWCSRNDVWVCSMFYKMVFYQSLIKIFVPKYDLKRDNWHSEMGGGSTLRKILFVTISRSSILNTN